MITPEKLKAFIRRNAGAIAESKSFCVIFSEKMLEDPAPVIQMGLAVYMDKPVLVLVPGSRWDQVPENLKRLAWRVETFDDSLPDDLKQTAMEAAVVRLLDGIVEMKKQS